jgi:hypothetical protein
VGRDDEIDEPHVALKIREIGKDRHFDISRVPLVSLSGHRTVDLPLLQGNGNS